MMWGFISSQMHVNSHYFDFNCLLKLLRKLFSQQTNTIFQIRELKMRNYVWVSEWVKSLSCVRLFATPWTVAQQAPLPTGFSRQEYLSGLPFPSPNYIWKSKQKTRKDGKRKLFLKDKEIIQVFISDFSLSQKSKQIIYTKSLEFPFSGKTQIYLQIHKLDGWFCCS